MLEKKIKNKHDSSNQPLEHKNSIVAKCEDCTIKDGEIKRLVTDRDGLLDRIERQSEEIGRLKEKMKE